MPNFAIPNAKDVLQIKTNVDNILCVSVRFNSKKGSQKLKPVLF